MKSYKNSTRLHIQSTVHKK